MLKLNPSHNSFLLFRFLTVIVSVGCLSEGCGFPQPCLEHNWVLYICCAFQNPINYLIETRYRQNGSFRDNSNHLWFIQCWSWLTFSTWFLLKTGISFPHVFILFHFSSMYAAYDRYAIWRHTRQAYRWSWVRMWGTQHWCGYVRCQVRTTGKI